MSVGDQESVRDLVRRSGEGDRRAFDELVGLTKTKALGFVISMIGNADDARDILQEGFLRAFTHIGRFRQEAKFQTWLYRILVNLTRDKIRKNIRARKLFEPMQEARIDDEGSHEPAQYADKVHTIHNEIFGCEGTRLLDAAVAALPEQQRLVFSMKYIDGKKLDEIARILGCRTGTVKAHLFRATQVLRRRLAFYRKKA
jgi:RNA polymerase sigma-70 factor, ECF subfamily